MDDGSIIELYFARDEMAISETNEKYGGFCRGIAMNILSSREDCEECVSDTWHKAWCSMPPEHPVCLMAWLGRIVRNISISRYRHEHAKKRFAGMNSMLAELEDCIPSNVSVEASVETARLARAIDIWLGTLTHVERALFVRRYWHGEPLSTLARDMGDRPERLAQRMLRLRKSLKAALEREEFDI